jgi:hypothetical protein
MRIENYREQPAASREVARFDIYLENMGMTFKEWRIIRKKAGGWFISAPSFCIEREGQKTWHEYISFSEARKKEFFDKLMDLVKGMIKE